MTCYLTYVRVPSAEDIINQQRNEDLARIEQELAAGMAQIEVDPLTGDARVVGASVAPEGMADVCVLDALQQRDSVEWQLAAAHAGVQQRDFAVQHAHSHNHHHGPGGHHHH